LALHRHLRCGCPTAHKQKRQHANTKRAPDRQGHMPTPRVRLLYSGKQATPYSTVYRGGTVKIHALHNCVVQARLTCKRLGRWWERAEREPRWCMLRQGKQHKHKQQRRQHERRRKRGVGDEGRGKKRARGVVDCWPVFTTVLLAHKELVICVRRRTCRNK
jgi:hypothetical protein